MKKLLSIILAAAMVMSLIPSVFALGVGDDGVVTYTFARGAVKKADGEAISDFDKSEIKGIWEWMEEPGSTAESPVHYSKGWFVGNLVGFGGHGWKFFGMNGAALAAAATQMRIGHLNSEYLQIANRVTNNNNTGTVNDDTIKLGLTLEKPEKGFYSVSVAAAPKNLGKNNIYTMKTDYYMNPESDSLTAEDSAKETALIDELTYKNTERMETFFSKIVYVDAENNLVFTVNPHWLNSKEIDQGLLLYEVSLKPVDGEAELVVADTELLPGETTTAAVKVSGKTLLNSFVDEYTLSANPTIEIDELGNIKATAVGATTITAMVGENKYEATVTVTEPAPAVTPDYDAAFGEDTYTTPDEKVNINPTVKVAAYAKDTTLSQTETTATKSGDIYEVKTPEEIGDYTFRYWARGLETGNRRIVSLENNFNYSAQNGDANWLIAVYAKDGEASETEYFNANGQLLTKADENTKPYMLGYGYATGWKDHGNGIKEAVYDESKIETYEITINGQTDTYTYGTEIKCPTVTVPENQYFWGWTKKVGDGEAELVSTDMNYTFYAWEDCEVAPKFGDSELVRGDIIARKILISSLDIGNGESVIKAEFIGFDNAVERGITLDKDYAMTRNDAKQFAIINDVQEESISAYAILADGTKFIYTLNK